MTEVRELWIRVHAHLSSKRIVPRLAAVCRPDSEKTAMGYLVTFWGNVADKGDNGFIRDTSDERLETWAEWKGKRGAFAAWVRANHMDEDGRVKHWDEFQGVLESKREADRVRKAQEREIKKSAGNPTDSPPDSPPDIQGTGERTSALTRADGDGTVRDIEPKPKNSPTGARIRTGGELAILEAVLPHKRQFWEKWFDGLLAGMGDKGFVEADLHNGCMDFLTSAEAPRITANHVRGYILNSRTKRLQGNNPPRRSSGGSFMDVA